MNLNPPSSSITPPMINNFWQDTNTESNIEPGMADPHDTTITSPIKTSQYISNTKTSHNNVNTLSSSNLMNQKQNSSNSKQHSMSSKDLGNNKNLKDSDDEMHPNFIGIPPVIKQKSSGSFPNFINSQDILDNSATKLNKNSQISI